MATRPANSGTGHATAQSDHQAGQEYPAARHSMLSTALRCNGIFSGTGGLGLVVASGPISRFLGLEQANAVPVMIVSGIVLLLYAARLFAISAREPIDIRAAIVAPVLDTVWVLASILLLVSGLLTLTPEGKGAVGIVADIVALFAGWQFYALRLYRRRSTAS